MTNAIVSRFVGSDGQILAIPAKYSRRLMLLEWLVSDFEYGVQYPEKQVNEILRKRHEDVAALRRYLVDAGLMSRANGIYQRVPQPTETSSKSGNILILGGTKWVGSHIAKAALAAGYQVTCLARGNQVPSGARSVVANRDDDDALAPVLNQHWDAVIDLATEPGHVRRAVRDLAACTDKYVFISSASVYVDLSELGVVETAQTHQPLLADEMSDWSDYASAKVAGEQAVMAGFGTERFVILRPGLIGGPGDSSGRTTYWPLRFANPSNPELKVLVPDSTNQPTSIVDVRDLAQFVITLLDNSRKGIFNVVGNSVPLKEHLKVAEEAGRLTHKERGLASKESHGNGNAYVARQIVAAAPEWLTEKKVNQWAGPRSLPLWLTDSSVIGMGAISNQKALAAGLELRPLSQTLADCLPGKVGDNWSDSIKSGLSDHEERELLNLLAASLA
jgi:nucleoside-diphosphate-sugar epimerase